MHSNNAYDLIRGWANFCFENPEKIKPTHHAIYLFAIETCNRLGWVDSFRFSTEATMQFSGIRSYNTYIKALNDLIGFKCIKMTEKSSNQYSANIISLVSWNKRVNTPLDKTLIAIKTVKTVKVIKDSEYFDKFWEIYPRGENTKKSKELFLKLSLVDQELIVLKTPMFLKNNPETKFVPQPSTYIRNRRWEDEVKIDTNKSPLYKTI